MFLTYEDIALLLQGGTQAAFCFCADACGILDGPLVQNAHLAATTALTP